MFSLDDLWKILHLVGLCLAIGSVFIVDIRTLKSMSEPSFRLKPVMPLLDTLHLTISIGLFLLIISGVAIVYNRFDSLDAIPDKVWMKSLLVGALLANSYYINKKVMPGFREKTNLIDNIPLITFFNAKERLQFAICSSLSTLGWGGAFLLGAVKAFKTMSFFEIAPYVAMFWLVGFFLTLSALDLIAFINRNAAKKLKPKPKFETSEAKDWYRKPENAERYAGMRKQA